MTIIKMQKDSKYFCNNDGTFKEFCTYGYPLDPQHEISLWCACACHQSRDKLNILEEKLSSVSEEEKENVLKQIEDFKIECSDPIKE